MKKIEVCLVDIENYEFIIQREAEKEKEKEKEKNK